MKIDKFLPLLFILFTIRGLCQDGPGGVGTTDGSSILELWFDSYDINGDGTNPTSGASVTDWADKSGNGVDVSENTANVATYSDPGVTFNNTGYLVGSDAGLPTGNASRTLFVVASTPNVAIDDVVFFYGRSSNNNSFGLLVRDTEDVRFYFYNNDIDDTDGWLPVNQAKVVGARYTSGTTGFREIFVNGQQTNSNNPGATPNTITNVEGLQIGGWLFHALYSQATIYEVLFYSSALNEAQRYIVENYLAARYGVSLAEHDIYNEDNPGNGNYDYDVAGIGRVNATNIHNDAQGTGIVRILNPTDLDNNEFLMWGHDNGVLLGIETSDVPPSVEARLDRVWRVSEVNAAGGGVNVGNIDMRFDLNNLGSVTASDLALLIDTDGDGNFSDQTPITGATDLGGNIFEFSGVTAIANNRRFTLGTTNVNQTPLPIELISFNATPVDNKYVKLEWETSEELNNDFFTIERTVDGTNWEEVLTVDGAGNSSEVLSYSAKDLIPITGTTYYRLKQTDFDGQYTYSRIVSATIELTSNDAVIVYPNPSQNTVFISGSHSEMEQVRIFDMLGQDVTSKVNLRILSDTKIVIDVSKLSSSFYFIKSRTATKKLFK